MDSFVKRVSKIPLDIPFDEAYYTHKLWMFFRESRETKEDIEIILNHLRKRMKQRTCLKKKSDLEKFAVPCLIKGNEYPSALCDTGSSVSIMPKTMAEELNLKMEPSNDSFTFVDCSKVNSGGIVKDVSVQINNTLVPVDFYVMDIQIDWNSSLLLGRAFMATVGAICDMKQNMLYLSLIDQNFFYEPVKNKSKTTLIELSNDVKLMATCFCNYEFNEEPEDGASTDTQPRAPIDAFAVQKSVDTHPVIDRRPHPKNDQHLTWKWKLHHSLPRVRRKLERGRANRILWYCNGGGWCLPNFLPIREIDIDRRQPFTIDQY
ncbi:hypothetical protein N665_0426s0013 [Sinapis alba]|nr:hypothetical protein N665_0426s0013 [Sinapis alba]